MKRPPRSTHDDDAEIDLDTQELTARPTQEPLGFGPGEWASAPPSDPDAGGSATATQQPSPESSWTPDQRVTPSEAEVDTLRARMSRLELEVATIRADLERLRHESERAAGSRLP